MKVLIIQQKMIGDVLASSTLFEAIKSQHPDWELHYLINQNTWPVTENNAFIDQLVVISEDVEKSKRKFWQFLQSVRKEKYDIVIDVYSKFSSNLITCFSGAQTKISKYKWYTAFIYTDTFRELENAVTGGGLALDNRWQLLKPVLNILHEPIMPKLYLSENEIENANGFLIDSGIQFSRPLFMISVLGSSVHKTYPLQYMADLLDVIVRITNGQILFNYIPNQVSEAKELYDNCKPETQKHIYFEVFGKNLRSFMAITKHCNALIGNEGGAVNMAKALNIPTFTIFSPWILKEAWNMFENQTTHISVHLKDYQPKLYEGIAHPKKLKKQALRLYGKFKPEFIYEPLKTFLRQFS